MSSETTNGNGAIVASSEQTQSIMAAGSRGVVLQNISEMHRFCGYIVKSGLTPTGIDSPEKAFVVLQTGLELGLAPMVALRTICVINMRPCLWGDGLIGLVRRSGLAEYIHETMEGEGDSLTAVCEAKRADSGDIIRRTFSVAEAKAAGLWGNPKRSPWINYPRRMLQMRARAFCLRDAFADVTLGMYAAEEFDVTPETHNATGREPFDAQNVAAANPDSASLDQLPTGRIEVRKPAASQSAKPAPVDKPKPEAKQLRQVIPTAHEIIDGTATAKPEPSEKAIARFEELQLTLRDNGGDEKQLAALADEFLKHVHATRQTLRDDALGPAIIKQAAAWMRDRQKGAA